jgi:hypothetical protein
MVPAAAEGGCIQRNQLLKLHKRALPAAAISSKTFHTGSPHARKAPGNGIERTLDLQT